MSARMRITRSKTGNRRSHHGLSPVRLSRDTKTNNLHVRHRVDLGTGTYRGKKIFEPVVKVKTAPSTEVAEETPPTSSFPIEDKKHSKLGDTRIDKKDGALARKANQPNAKPPRQSKKESA